MENTEATPDVIAKQRGLLIGLCGYAESGKDSLADVLTTHLGYVKLSFADPLWNLCLTINPRLRIGLFRRWHLQKIATRYGYHRAKQFPAVRKYMQWLGTEAIRECLGEDAWVNALMPRVDAIRKEGRGVIITNVRFPNEGAAVQDRGGYVVRVDRKGKGPVNDHSSDAGLAFPMATLAVDNSGTLDELAIQAAHVHHYLSHQHAQQHCTYLRLYTGPTLSQPDQE